jgi:uncharacterized membrane protein YciS (DUF1049 family)
MIRKLKNLMTLLFLLIVVLISLHFLAENKAPMTVQTLVGDFVDIASGQVLMWVFIFGTVIGAVLGFLPISGYLLKLKRLERQLAREKAKNASSETAVSQEASVA